MFHFTCCVQTQLLFRRRVGIPASLIAFMALASPPVALASVAIYVGKNLTKDGSVLLAGFGSGLTWGATLMKWA